MGKAFLGVSEINQETDKSTTIEDCVELCEKSGWEYRWLLSTHDGKPIEIYKDMEDAIEQAKNIYKGCGLQVLDLFTQTSHLKNHFNTLIFQTIFIL